MKNANRISAIIRILRKRYKAGELAVELHRDPYRVLISCLLSQRTRDENTLAASQALFALADTPRTMLKIAPAEIRQAIHPAGFFRRKTRSIIEISRALVDRYDSKVPADLEELLTLRGVGRKTANIVLALGFGLPAIAVDVHVHRISNRLGILATDTPEETELALMEVIPRRYWPAFNGLLVRHGRAICKPIRPLCERCPIASWCDKIIAPVAGRGKK